MKLICIIFLLIPIYLNGQCSNIIKNEIDEFKGYKSALVGDDGSLTYTLKGTKCKNCNTIGRLAFGKKGDQYYIRLHLFLNEVWSASENNLVEIKMLNGHVLDLKILNYELADKRSVGFMDWNGFVYASISKEQLDLFQNVEIDKIRIQLNTGYSISRVSRSKQVKEFANCIENL